MCGLLMKGEEDMGWIVFQLGFGSVLGILCMCGPHVWGFVRVCKDGGKERGCWWKMTG